MGEVMTPDICQGFNTRIRTLKSGFFTESQTLAHKTEPFYYLNPSLREGRDLVNTLCHLYSLLMDLQ